MPNQEGGSDAIRIPDELLRMQYLLSFEPSADQVSRLLQLRRLAIQKHTLGEQPEIDQAALPSSIDGQVQEALAERHVDPFFRVTGDLYALERSITEEISKGSILSQDRQLKYPFSGNTETQTPATGEILLNYTLERNPRNRRALYARIKTVQYLVKEQGADVFTEGVWITPDRDKNKIVKAVEFLPMAGGNGIRLNPKIDIDRASRTADNASWVLQLAAQLVQGHNKENTLRKTA